MNRTGSAGISGANVAARRAPLNDAGTTKAKTKSGGEEPELINGPIRGRTRFNIPRNKPDIRSVKFPRQDSVFLFESQ